MEDLIAIFPLNLVVYPGEKLNLHIFEPRYIQLINDVQSSGRSFGIPPYIDGVLSDIGTEIILLHIEKEYENGRMDIKTQAISVFDIIQVQNQTSPKLYTNARIQQRSTDMEFDPVKNIQILDLVKQLYKALEIKKSIDYNPKDSISFSIGHHIGLNKEQELALLKLPSELERQNFILDHLSQFVPKAMRMEEMRKKIQMNGHFKYLDPLDYGL